MYVVECKLDRLPQGLAQVDAITALKLNSSILLIVSSRIRERVIRGKERHELPIRPNRAPRDETRTEAQFQDHEVPEAEDVVVVLHDEAPHVEERQDLEERKAKTSSPPAKQSKAHVGQTKNATEINSDEYGQK